MTSSPLAACVIQARQHTILGSAIPHMNGRSIPALRGQALISLSVLVLGVWVAWQIGGKIAGDDLRSIEFAALGLAGLWVGDTILRRWRTGFYMFMVWVLFEDLVRKYLGNNMADLFRQGCSGRACVPFVFCPGSARP